MRHFATGNMHYINITNKCRRMGSEYHAVRKRKGKKHKFKEELIVYFTLIRHGPHKNRRIQYIFFATGKC
jgi:hypothetical protein